MTEHQRRLIAGALLPAAGIAIALGANLISVGPSRLASNWGLNGNPTDSMSATAFAIMVFALISITGAAAFVSSRRGAAERGDLTPPVAIATFLQWAFVGMAATTYWANNGASDWTNAKDLGPLITLGTPLAAGIVAYGAGRTVASIGPERTVDRATLPTVGKGANDRLVWIGHARATWPLLIAAPLAVLGIAIFYTAGPVPAAGILAIGLLVALFTSVSVSADLNGLTVAYGPFGWSRSAIALARIDLAQKIDVRPMKHGGWGYRGSLRLMGKAAVVLRGGEGIQLDLADGKTFVVTVDDAETGAGTINDLVTP